MSGADVNHGAMSWHKHTRALSEPDLRATCHSDLVSEIIGVRVRPCSHTQASL